MQNHTDTTGIPPVSSTIHSIERDNVDAEINKMLALAKVYLMGALTASTLRKTKTKEALKKKNKIASTIKTISIMIGDLKKSLE